MKIAIEKNRDAIGYVGLANSGVKGETKAVGEKAISVNGIACSPANVKKETYPLWRYDWSGDAVQPSEPRGAAVLHMGAHERGRRQVLAGGRRGACVQQEVTPELRTGIRVPLSAVDEELILLAEREG